MRWNPFKKKAEPDGYYEKGRASYDPIIHGAPDLRKVPRIPLKYFFMGFGALIIVGLIRGHQPVSLTKSCTTPAFALSSSTPRQLAPVRFAITGPSGTYILGIDISGYVVKADGTVTLIPDMGKAIADVQTASGIATIGGCKGSGLFNIRVAPGEHTIRMFRIEKTGATLVSTQKLSVTAPKQ